MDPISEARRAVEELLRSQDLRGQQIKEQMRRINEPVPGTAAWQAMRAIDAINQLASKIQYSQSLLSFSQPVTRKWNVDADPNVPAEFKRSWRSLLQAQPRRKQKILAVWSLIAARNPEALIKPLQASNSIAPTLYSIEANAICQYLRLAEEHYRLGLGPVLKGELWDRVCKLHVAIFKSAPPTHRSLILKKIGLGSLPERPPGRPSRK
jgi:hypothetical protein